MGSVSRMAACNALVKEVGLGLLFVFLDFVDSKRHAEFALRNDFWDDCICQPYISGSSS